MKLNNLLTIGACAALALASLNTGTALAEEHEEKMTMPMPDTVDGIIQAIHKERAELGDTVTAKKLDDVHHHAFAIRDLANGLPAKVAADKKARVEGSVKNIAKLAEALDGTGDAHDQEGTEANVKKLDGVLMVLEKQLK